MTAPLFNTERFTKDLENIYMELFNNYKSKNGIL